MAPWLWIATSEPHYIGPQKILAVLNGFNPSTAHDPPFSHLFRASVTTQMIPSHSSHPSRSAKRHKNSCPVSASMAVKAASASWGHFGISPCLGLVELQVPIFTHTVAVNQHMLVDPPQNMAGDGVKTHYDLQRSNSRRKKYWGASVEKAMVLSHVLRYIFRSHQHPVPQTERSSSLSVPPWTHGHVQIAAISSIQSILGTPII